MTGLPFSSEVDVDLRVEGHSPGDKVDPSDHGAEHVQAERLEDIDSYVEVRYAVDTIKSRKWSQIKPGQAKTLLQGLEELDECDHVAVITRA